MQWLASLVTFVQSNPVLLFAVLFLLFRKWQASRPWPDFGGRLTSVPSKTQWEATLASASERGQLVVVDCYATWCPPCRSCAPIYAKMRCCPLWASSHNASMRTALSSCMCTALRFLP